MYSKEHQSYLKGLKREKLSVILIQLSILLIFIGIWEAAARFGWINTFLLSSPSRIVATITRLANENNLWQHIYTTCYETIISFLLGAFIASILATALWWNEFLAKVLEPYLTIINSLPKVALGPVIIIWVGANTNSIIFMALLISVIVSTLTIYQGFITTDENRIKLFKTFKASKLQTYLHVVLPSNYPVIIGALKINISMSLIGVIMGELLVSKQGLGYLIMFGSQVFNLDLVISGVILLGIVSALLYYIVSHLEKKILKK